MTISKFDKTMAEISSQVPQVQFDDVTKIIFLILEKLLPEASKEILKDAAVNCWNVADKREALRILTESK